MRQDANRNELFERVQKMTITIKGFIARVTDKAIGFVITDQIDGVKKDAKLAWIPKAKVEGKRSIEGAEPLEIKVLGETISRKGLPHILKVNSEFAEKIGLV